MTGDPYCDMAHGELPPETEPRTLVVVFASPVADYLLHFGGDLGYRTVLVEPDPVRVTDSLRGKENARVSVAEAAKAGELDSTADVVVTDHDRPELGDVLRDALATDARWIGVMGSVRHTAPHVAALAERGVPEPDIARVHRPIGLNIGSHTPAEIAVATLAGLIADRNHKPGGFTFG